MLFRASGDGESKPILLLARSECSSGTSRRLVLRAKVHLGLIKFNFIADPTISSTSSSVLFSSRSLRMIDLLHYCAVLLAQYEKTETERGIESFPLGLS